MLTVSGRDSISASPLCGFLRSSEHVGCSTPAQQTIAVVSIDSAGLWSGNGCNLNTSGSVVSARSLCDERQLWDETTRAFKNVQVFGWPAFSHQTRCSHETNTRQKFKGCLKGVHASVLIYCGLICQIFIVNWHGVKYPNRDIENIHVGEKQIMEEAQRARVCLGWGEKNTTQTELYIPHLIYVPSVWGVSPLSNRPPKRKLVVKCDIIKSGGIFDYE